MKGFILIAYKVPSDQKCSIGTVSSSLPAYLTSWNLIQGPFFCFTVALERHNTPPPEQKWFLLLPATAAADLALTAFLATHLEHCAIFLKHPKPACFFHLALASWACRSPHRPDRQSASSSRIRNSYESSSLSRYSAKWSFRVRGAEVLHPACFCLPGDRLRLKTFLVVTTPSEWERNAAGTS